VGTETGVAVRSIDTEVLLHRTCEAAQFDEADWLGILGRVPPINPCVPRGFRERMLAFIDLQ
jgi:hypothetical protein